MSGKRIPKVGEVWMVNDAPCTVLAVDGTQVWCRFDDPQDDVPWRSTWGVMALTPLPPTKVSSNPVRADEDCATTDYSELPPVGHLILWSDGSVTYEAVTP